MAWTNISNANLDVGAPIRSVDILSLRDNIAAQANGDAGAPKQQTAGIADLAITAAKMSGNQPGSAPAFAARAWVNFNGTGTVAIRSSGNVSSITDNGTGTYTVNFATAMQDDNYCVSGICKEEDGGGSSYVLINMQNGTYSSVFTTTAVKVSTILASNGSGRDSFAVCVNIFR